MLGEALTYPSRRDGWLKTVAVGGLLVLASPLVLPLFVLSGYFVSVLRSSAHEVSRPPVFERWGDLLVDGLKATAIQVVYGVVALVLLFAVAVVALALSPAVSETAPSTTTTQNLTDASVGVLLFGYLFVAVVGYVSLAALARFAHEERIYSAFEVRTVVRTAFTSEFFVAFVLAVGVGLVLGLIAAALSVILLGLFVLVYVQIVVSHLLGRGYGRARERLE